MVGGLPLKAATGEAARGAEDMARLSPLSGALTTLACAGGKRK